MTPLRNGEIADLFDLLGDLYELDGAVVYRVLAYRRAAKRFRETAESVWSLSEQGRLTELDDIGDTIAHEGRRAARDGHDAGAREAARARAREPRRDRAPARARRQDGAQAVAGARHHDARRARGRRARRAACEGFAGFGERKEQQLLAQLEAGAAPRKRVFRLDQALELARTVLEPLRAHPACERADEAGSLRRRAETRRRRRRDRGRGRRARADGLARRAAVRRRGARPGHHQGLDPDAQRRPARPARRAARELRQPAAALHGLEGPQRAHARGRPAARHERLGVGHRGRGERRGLPHAATRTRSTATSATQPIPPELREDNGELELARRNELPELVELADLRGDLHLHSDWSARQALAARRRRGRAGPRARLHRDHRPLGRRRHGHRPRGRRRAAPDRGRAPDPRDARRLRAAGRLRGRHHGRRDALPARRRAGRARLGRRLAARRAAAGLRPHHEAAAGGRRAPVRRRHRAPVRPPDRRARGLRASTSRRSSRPAPSTARSSRSTRSRTGSTCGPRTRASRSRPASSS